jgi:HD-like signal output (HDOD) protein
MAGLKERFASDIEGLTDLPALSPVIAQLLATLGRDDAGVAEIGEIIRQEPVLTAKVLRAANAAFYAGRAPATSIRDALLRLGLVTVRRLTMVMSLYNAMPGRGARIGQHRFWQHSLALGHAAALVAYHSETRPSDVDNEVVFLTGLLHDIGLLVLASHYPREFDAAASLAKQDGLGLPEAELAALETDHGELGGVLIAHWGLPEVIAGPIAVHHRVPAAPEEHRWGAAVIEVADQLCTAAGQGLDEPLVGEPDWAAAGIRLADAEKVTSAVQVELQRASAMLAGA